MNELERNIKSTVCCVHLCEELGSVLTKRERLREREEETILNNKKNELNFHKVLSYTRNDVFYVCTRYMVCVALTTHTQTQQKKIAAP